MKGFITIPFFIFCLLSSVSKSFSQQKSPEIIYYFGDSIAVNLPFSLPEGFKQDFTEKKIRAFYSIACEQEYSALIKVLLQYKEEKKLDDWLFYQLVRKTAQQIVPKEDNYKLYTLYKWFLLVKCGYDAQLAFANEHLLFYVKSPENIYDIPLFSKDGQQYVCLNIHDTGPIDFVSTTLNEVMVDSSSKKGKAFSYKVSQLPVFNHNEIVQKKLLFSYEGEQSEYIVKLDKQMQVIFKNYPSVDMETYFNIPLSAVTYGSLIPSLKKKLKKVSQLQGVDYLMRFTRNAFMYQDDSLNFGKEKRLSPEQTLYNEFSDCDDRVALFYYLVKEIYNLPMIVLVYPSHAALAMQLKTPVGSPVIHNGKKYTVCEPTPQKVDLPIGELMPELKRAQYYIAYEYIPVK